MENPAIDVRIRIPALPTISVHFVLRAVYIINTDKCTDE